MVNVEDLDSRPAGGSHKIRALGALTGANIRSLHPSGCEVASMYASEEFVWV